MPVHNTDIASIFNEVADLLEIKGENRFRVRAYRDAARTIDGLSQSAADMVDQGEDLSNLSGIGKDLAGKIKQIVENGSLKMLDDLHEELPEGLTQMTKIATLGPKKINKIYNELDVKDISDLKKAVQEGRIRELEGFGEKTEKKIAEELEGFDKGQQERLIISEAVEITENFVDYLKKAKGVKDISVAGSYRRRKETVGDIDILVTCRKDSNVVEKFTDYEYVDQIIAKGKSKSSVVLKNGLQVDLRLVPKVAYGAAMIYFTGSKQHNIAIRKIAVKKKWKINEYGIFKGDERIAGKTEKQVYEKIGLKYIPPEMRENRGEIKAAQKDKLPNLVKVDDIKGDLHTHSKYTDGKNTIKEMAEAAGDKGYEYIAMTDHSQRVRVAGGLNAKELEKQIDEIDKLNDKLDSVTVLKAAEVDILEDGSLDLVNSILKKLDLTVCSIHSKFELSRKKQTQRVLKAMENPYFNIFGHPTCRMLQSRKPIDIDLDEVMKQAKKLGCVLELNANPERLDLNDIHCKAAKDIGVKISIGTDSHRTTSLDFIQFGIDQARRGWLEKGDIINTSSLNELLQILKRS